MQKTRAQGRNLHLMGRVFSIGRLAGEQPTMLYSQISRFKRLQPDWNEANQLVFASLGQSLRKGDLLGCCFDSLKYDLPVMIRLSYSFSKSPSIDSHKICPQPNPVYLGFR
jgi:hypothetical protein